MAYIVCTSNLDLVSFLFVPGLYILQVNEKLQIRKWNIGMAQKESRQDQDGLYA